MKKLTIKKLVEFRSKQERGKKNFATAVKQNKPEPKKDGGGDYWISTVSAIARAYKEKNPQLIKLKIKELGEKIETTKSSQVKAQYKRNIEILRKYENFDFKKWVPPGKPQLLKNHKAMLTIKELLVETSPNVVFSFGKDQQDEVGAIWLVAKKEGFKREEMGMFTDILARYLRNQYGKKYAPNPRYCLAVDVVSMYEVNYSQLQNAEIPYLLNKTIDELKRLM
jgi:hypothetical protein